MNRSYRLVWNDACQRFIPAPEIARGRGKGGRRAAQAVVTLATLLGLGGLSPASWAVGATTLPSGGQVVAGQATLTSLNTSLSPGALAAASLTVNQTSQRAVINWNSFNIGSAARVDFVQPGPSAVALNRVIGSEPSQIFGQLRANGQVFLVNPNGVLFAQGAQVNVHGLLASTLHASDTDFMAGTLHFAGKAGAVRNEGQITTDAGGYVGLLGGQVSNTGTITAQLGRVALVAGSDATLDFAGDGLLNVAVKAGAVQAWVDNAGLIQADGGRVQMSAQAADALVSAAVNNTGLIQAHGLQMQGGVIELAGDAVYQAGTLDVSGAQGGHVAIHGLGVLQTGVIQADGLVGAGGQIELLASQQLLQTQGALIHADGSTQGGTVVLGGGQSAYLSGQSHAHGGLQGGQIDVSAVQLTLAGASLGADGQTTGGRVRIGGDAHGGALVGLNNAQAVRINSTTQLSAGGEGGRVVVWSEGDTRYDGTATAGGRTAAGFIEISAKGTLHFSGQADPGQGGELLLDPTDIVIDVAGAPTNYISLASPGSTSVGTHAFNGVFELSNGNLVVASENDSFGLTAGSGVVSLYDGRTGGLISTLYGLSAGDGVGRTVLPLKNGNVVVASSWWDSAGLVNAGAVTLVPGATGLQGPVSVNNSLTGSAASDQIGSEGLFALSDGHVVVASSQWQGATGAVTWLSGTAGLAGQTVSAANSWTGALAGDKIGLGGGNLMQGVVPLLNGDYVIVAPTWNGSAGAATLVHAGNVSGVVSAANSLVGAAPGDQVGWDGATLLANGDYVIRSSRWSAQMGAATLVSGVTGLAKANAGGVVTATNSLTGTTAGDAVGSGSVTPLVGGDYVVASPSWQGTLGAVTLVSGATGLAKIDGLAQVSNLNSLTGAAFSDQIGSAGVVALPNGAYVVSSPMWTDPTNPVPLNQVGAVTWLAPTNTLVGPVISAANSLIGSSFLDNVGFNGVVVLKDGNYLINSPWWSTAAVSSVGAVTWGNGLTGTTGTVSTQNSWVGTSANDQVGSNGVTVLSNGHFVINSPFWGGGLGAVTWVDQTLASGGGLVQASNSLTGVAVTDSVGSGGVIALTGPGGDYVVSSPNWSGVNASVGAVTKMYSGPISANTVVGTPNSLVGTLAGDQLGSGHTVGGAAGLMALSTGAYTINSPNFNGGAGAVWLVKDTLATPYYTPERIAAMTPAGVYVTLAATNTITVNAPVTVGGSLELNAGNTLTLNAPLTSTETSPTALVMVAGQQFINNAGATALSTPNGKWQVWSANPANDVRGGLVPNFKQYNATPGSATQPRSAALGSGNGMFYTLAPTLSPTLSSTGPVVRVYDTTTSAPQAGLSLGATGAVDGDAVVLSAAAFDYTVAGVASKQAGSGLDVSASGLSVQASNGPTLVYGYQLASTTASVAGVGTIQQATLTVGPTGVANKVYDATTSATISTPGALSGVLSGVLGVDKVGLSQSAAFQDKNVGLAKPVVVTNTLTGVDAGNYIVTNTTSSADITPFVLTPGQPGQPGQPGAPSVTGTAVAATKVYDATAAAQITTQGSFTGALAADQVSVASQTASYDTKNIGTAKPVTVTTLLQGADAANYSVAPISLSADITPATLGLSGTTVAPTKVYDATTTALITAMGTLSAPLGADQVSILSQSAAYADKNVGTAKPVTVTTVLQGADAGNYVIAPITAQADITRLVLTPGQPGQPGAPSVTGTAVAATKVYDATAAAAITTQGSFTGALAADQVSVARQPASYDTKNIGTAKPVTVTTLLQGADAGNYVIAPITAQADITKLTIVPGAPGQAGGNVTGTAVAATKVYDATAAAAITTQGSFTGALAADQVSVLSQTASYDTKNVGTAKPVTVATTLTGADAGNYDVAPITLNAAISPMALTAVGTAVASKLFDATTIATISTPAQLSGVFSGDGVMLAQTAAFADPNVGTNKVVNVQSSLSGGADVGNYVLANPSTQVQADIFGALPPGDPLQRLSRPLKAATARDANAPDPISVDASDAGLSTLDLAVVEADLDTPSLSVQKPLSTIVLGDGGDAVVVVEDVPPLPPALVEQKKELETIAAGTGVTVSKVTTQTISRLKVSIPGDMSFSSGKANITPVMAKILDQLADTIHPDQQVEVIGHTDSVGSAALNQRLSEDRAAEVRTYLIKRKVAADHIRSSGRGKNEPVADNRTAAGRAKNRRVDIYVAQPGGEVQKVK